MNRRQFICQTLAGAGIMLGAAPVMAASAATKQFLSATTVDSSLFQGINRAQNQQKMSLLEKKHQPLIELPDRVSKGQPTEVSISIGEVLHPMSQAHYIDHVEIFAGNEPAGRLAFRPDFSLPRGTFYVHLDKPVTLIVRAYCNLHGLWESRLEVTPL